MVLTADIGNSSITVGLFGAKSEGSDGELVCKSKYSTDARKSADEYAALIYNTFTLNGIGAEAIEAVMIASVVPQLTDVIKDALSKLIECRIYVLGPGIKTGVNIRTDDPSELGSDIVANAVGALSVAEPPFVMIDMGTATSVFAVDRHRAIVGGCIAPGLRISLDALKNSTSQLPAVSLNATRSVICKNTDSAIRAGLLGGHAMMIDGMIDAFARELGESELTAVITGGLANTVLPLIGHKTLYSENMTLDGLFEIYKLNSKKLSAK